MADYDLKLAKRAIFQPRLHNQKVVCLPFEFKRDGVAGYRWDSVFLDPINDNARDLACFLKHVQPERKEYLTQPGDTLIVDNWRILHGRGEVLDGEIRELERVYLGGINV